MRLLNGFASCRDDPRRRSCCRTAALPHTGRFSQELTFGQRLADKVASFGGFQTFNLAFGAVLFVWVAINLVLLHKAFDPYRFIFLNLLLSTLAAIHAPVIMIRQNRPSVRCVGVEALFIAGAFSR